MAARILILDGHSSASLAFVRSLGHVGHWIAVGFKDSCNSPAAVSCYCRKTVTYSDPMTSIESFCATIQEFVDRYGIDLVLPMTDATIWPLSQYEGRTQSKAFNSILPANKIDLVSDKYKTVQLGRELGFPVPKTLLVRKMEDLDGIVEWDFPVVVKDRYSVRWNGDTGVPGYTSYAFSRDELIRLVRSRVSQTGDALVQSFVPGKGVGYSCFAIGENTYLPFQWVRLREKDPKGLRQQCTKIDSFRSRNRPFCQKTDPEIRVRRRRHGGVQSGRRQWHSLFNGNQRKTLGVYSTGHTQRGGLPETFCPLVPD